MPLPTPIIEVLAAFRPLFTHGLRNEVAPWRSSAPRPLSFIPRAKRWWIVAFRLHSGTRCWMHMTREGRPQLIFDMSLHFSIADMRTSFYRFWW